MPIWIKHLFLFPISPTGIVFIPIFHPLYPLIWAVNGESSCLSLWACLGRGQGTDVRAQAAPLGPPLLRALPWKLSKVDRCLWARWWSAPPGEAPGRLSCQCGLKCPDPQEMGFVLPCPQ